MAGAPTLEKYILHPRNDTQAAEELERLDDMHNGIKAYLGGALSFAPLEGCNPKRILELGSGTGVWALQAAGQYPDAQVLAVDLTPLPPRPNGIPPNLKFQAHDLTQPFPWEHETFDIVHSRFVFIHLPAFGEVLDRMIKLVKPGGWLLLEDVEVMVRIPGGQSPGQKELWDTVHVNMRKNGIDPFAPAAFSEDILRKPDIFSEVNVHKVIVPFTGARENPDDKLAALGATMKTSCERSTRQFVANSLVTNEVGERAQAECRDPRYKQYMTMYFTWSRK